MSLCRGSASPAYLTRQFLGASQFWGFFVAKQSGAHNEWNKFDPNEIDNVLADWVQHEFESDKTLYDTTCGVLAVQKHFNCALAFRRLGCVTSLEARAAM